MDEFKHPEQREEKDELTLFDLIQRLISNEGWDRKLEAEEIPPGNMVQVRRKIVEGSEHDYSETDIIGNYSVDDYQFGELTRDSIRYDFRKFLRSRDEL